MSRKKQVSKYDYTKFQTIQNANQEFAQSIEQKRGQLLYNEKRKNNEYNQPKSENQYKPSDQASSYQDDPGYDVSNKCFDLSHMYDYTNAQPIKDANITYEEQVNQQRGIPTSNARQQETENHLQTEKYSTPYRDDRSLICDKDDISEPQSNFKYDYTNAQPIRDANITYEEQVNRQRGIPTYHSNCNTGAYSFEIVENFYNTENSHIPLEMQKLLSAIRFSGESKGPMNENDLPEVFKNRFSDIQKKYTSINYNGLSSSEIQKLINDCTKDMNNLVRGLQEEPVFVSPLNRYRAPGVTISNKGIDRSTLYSDKLFEKNGLPVKGSDLTDNEIHQLLCNRGLYSSKNVRYKFGKQTQKFVGLVASYMYNSSAPNTEFGQGLRKIQEIITPVTFVVTDAVLMSAHKTMEKGMAHRINNIAQKYQVFGEVTKLPNGKLTNEFIAIPNARMSKHEIQCIREEILKKMNPSNFKGISTNGEVALSQTYAFLRKNKNNLTMNEKGAVLIMAEIAKYERYGDMIKRKRSRFRRSMHTKLFRYLQQDATGHGIIFTMTLYARTYQTIKIGICAVSRVASAATKASLIAYKLAKKVSIALLRTKLGEMIEATKIGSQVIDGAKKVSHGATKASAKARNATSRLADLRNQVRATIHDPFKIRSMKNKLVDRFWNTRIGKFFSPINWVKGLITKLLSMVISFISTLISIIMIIIGVLLTVIIVFIVVFSVFTWIFTIFDLDSSRRDIIKSSLNYVQELTKKDDEKLNDLNRRYRNVTIAFEDEKNSSVYEEKENQTIKPVVETTNSAEMLSMAQVYFDFDFESQSKKKREDYLEKLYNNSHITTIVETPYYITNDKGETKIGGYDAVVKSKTYYFDYIFNTKLSNSGSVGIISGNDITEQVWNYLRTAGVAPEQAAGIMGNMYAESGFDPSIVEHGNGIGFGLCQWSYGRRDALEAFAASQGKDPGDLQVQLDYLMTELNPGHFNSYYTGMDNYTMFMNATTPEDATYYFMWGWERPAEWAGNASLEKRQIAAKTYYDTYKDRELVTEKPKK